MKSVEKKLIRLFDIVFSLMGIVLFLPLMSVIFFLCWLDTGSPIFSQPRLGKNKIVFNLLKFRTMGLATISRPTHQISKQNITYVGSYLRKYKLDELPQFFNVLRGEMSLVGPRPGLPGDKELTVERDKLNVFEVLPGMTGLSQICKIDMSSPEKLAITDKVFIDTCNIFQYFKILWLTIYKNIRS